MINVYLIFRYMVGKKKEQRVKIKEEKDTSYDIIKKIQEKDRKKKKKKRRKYLRSMCCGKNSSSATCVHGAGIACMKEETKRIKRQEDVLLQ